MNTPGTPAPGTTPEAPLPEDFQQLVAATLDGSLSPKDRARLGQLVATQPAARAFYLNYLATHTLLQWSHDALPTLNLPETTAGTSHKPDDERQRVVGITPPSASNLRIPQPAILAAVSGIAATLLAACGVAIYLLAFNTPTDPQPDTSQHGPPGPPVATLIHNTGNLTTPHDYPAEGDDYSAGQYTLTSGAAEFMLTNAVNVKLRGDTRMTMLNNMNVSLTRGKADFVVPKDATGFTVHLPDGSRVVDLGTAFSVDVDDAGRTVVRVVDGEVAWTNTDDTADSASVVAGQYAVIESGSLVSNGTAMVIEPVDTIIDDANQQISRWRSPEFPKSLDTDGDHRYGSDGYAMLGIKSDLPAYLEFVELGTDIRIPPPNDKYAAVDRPDGTKRIKLRTLGQGDLNASPGDIVDVITYRITDASLVPRGFRVGIMTDGLDHADFASASIHLVDASSSEHVRASIGVDRYRNKKLDMVFFDVTHVRTGDALTIRVAKSPRSTATIQAITFDPLPAPPSESNDTSSGDNRPGALAPNPTSEPVELQTTGPEKSLRKVRSERDED